MKNFVFAAIGMPIQFDSDYDSDNHWRFIKPNRLYHTNITVYNDIAVEPNTYDQLSHKKGFKWQLVTNFLRDFDHTQYEYIGFFDQDIVTDIQNLNTAFQVAKSLEIMFFQLSLNPKNPTPSLPHLTQKTKFAARRIPYVEGMAPIFHTSLIPLLKQLLNFYEFKIGWGLDVILPSVLKTKPFVIDKVSMLHKPIDQSKPSVYNSHNAFNEYVETVDIVYPKFMKIHYGEDAVLYPGEGTVLEQNCMQRERVVAVDHPLYGRGKCIKYNKDSRGLTLSYDIQFQDQTRTLSFFDIVLPCKVYFLPTKKKI